MQMSWVRPDSIALRFHTSQTSTTSTVSHVHVQTRSPLLQGTPSTDNVLTLDVACLNRNPRPPSDVRQRIGNRKRWTRQRVVRYAQVRSRQPRHQAVKFGLLVVRIASDALPTLKQTIQASSPSIDAPVPHDEDLRRIIRGSAAARTPCRDGSPSAPPDTAVRPTQTAQLSFQRVLHQRSIQEVARLIAGLRRPEFLSGINSRTGETSATSATQPARSSASSEARYDQDSVSEEYGTEGCHAGERHVGSWREFADTASGDCDACQDGG